MNLFTRLYNASQVLIRGSFENPRTSFSSAIDALFDGSRTASGIRINENTSMQIPAVYGAVRVLSDAVSSLPLGVFEKTDSGAKQLDAHPVNKLLAFAPNRLQTSTYWRETKMGHTLLWGNGYSFIDRGKIDGTPIALLPIMPNRVEPELQTDGVTLIYRVDSTTLFDSSEIIHLPAFGFDGLKGKSPIQWHKENIGLAAAQQQFGANFFGNAATPNGVLEHPGKLGEPALENVRKSWQKNNGGVGNTGKTVILEEGMKYAPISIPPDQAQYLESRRFSVEDIARIFNIPQHKLGGMEAATFSNITQQDLDFVKYSVRPWLVKFEDELERKLLTEQEREAGMFIKFDMSELLRADPITRANVNRAMLERGALSANEWRADEGRNAIDGGDEFVILSNLQDADLSAPKDNSTKQ